MNKKLNSEVKGGNVNRTNKEEDKFHFFIV